MVFNECIDLKGQSADYGEAFVDMADDLRLNATISRGDLDAVEVGLEEAEEPSTALPVSSSHDHKNVSTHGDAGRPKLRSGVRLNRAASSCVETGGDEDPTLSKTEAEQIRAKHIIKIFLEDKDHFIEVSPEQLERVRTMHKNIEDGASFSFNYNTLLIVASILAGLGLVSNSSTNIIASMLVSPIMGPVVGLAYGTTIRDWKLVRKSLKTECISLVVCIFIGVTLGVVTGLTELADDWPTQEMVMRGTTQNFIVAIPVAFFSGLGVAVSMLDDQTSSLVGVAISASLLPPAVNAGILWIAFVFAKSNVTDPSCNEDIVSEAIQEAAAANEAGRALGNGFFDAAFDTQEHHFFDECDDDSHVGQYYRSGVVSLLLTLANIILIWISGMLMFRMKEVLPIKKKVFWEDLGVARKVYQHRAMLSSEHFQKKANGGNESSTDEEDNIEVAGV